MIKTLFLGVYFCSFDFAFAKSEGFIKEPSKKNSFASAHCAEAPQQIQKVTEYVTPVLNDFDHQICIKNEGSCLVKGKRDLTLYNSGKTKKGESVSSAKCTVGYGSDGNCLNPCRSIAAHVGNGVKLGDVLYFPELVGKSCPGLIGKHDGYMIIADVGAAIQGQGRFDFFWGACKKYSSEKKKQVCLDKGALSFTHGLDKDAKYCKVFSVNKKNHGTKPEIAEFGFKFEEKIREEAAALDQSTGIPASMQMQSFTFDQFIPATKKKNQSVAGIGLN